MMIKRMNELRGLIRECIKEKKNENIIFYEDGSWAVETMFTRPGVYTAHVLELGRIAPRYFDEEPNYALNRSITERLRQVDEYLQKSKKGVVEHAK